MSVNLNIDNFDSNNIYQTDKLTQASAAGDSTLNVLNTNGYIPLTFVIVGALGTDDSELSQISGGINSTTVALMAPVTINHQQNDSLTLLYGDQLRIYRAANTDNYPPPDTAYTPIATINIVYDEVATKWVDTNGSSAYWYKVTYFNSHNQIESLLSDSVYTRGSGYGAYCSVDDIRRTAGMVNNEWITDSDIDTKRLEAQSEINAALNGMYTVPFKAPFDPMIPAITRLLAAGKLMKDDPGGSGNNSVIYQQGVDKEDEARTMLALIDNRKYFLNDITGLPIISPNSQSSKSFPDATTTVTTVGPNGQHSGSERAFRMADVSNDPNVRRY